MTSMARPKAILFDTFGTVVDWRGSLTGDLTAFGRERGVDGDWPTLVERWRAAYAPSMDRVRRGELPWTHLDNLHRLSLDVLIGELGITGFSGDDLEHVNLGWHRLRPWGDAVAGLGRLKREFIIGPLSNGTVKLLVDLAKIGGLPWDVILGSDLFRHYKPDPEVYLGACALLHLEPGDVMLAAAHNGDLAKARSYGLQTAFFPRPGEYGPERPRDLEPDQDWEIVARDIEDLAARLDV